MASSAVYVASVAMMMEGLEQMLCGLRPAHSGHSYWNMSVQFALYTLFCAHTVIHSN